jgi:Tfp pilus assembly protein PilF
MCRSARWAAWLVVVAGCGPSVAEEVRKYNDLGVHLFQQGDYAGSRESFQVGLTFQPENAGLLYNIGECYDHLGNTAKAEEFYNQCLQRDANHARCRHSLAVLLVKTNRRKQAVYMVEDWLRREPKRPDPYSEDGWLWHQAGDLPQAQARLQQALDVDPHNVRALTELALVYEDLGIPERAIVLYERVLDVDPRQPDVARRLDALKAKGTKRPTP